MSRKRHGQRVRRKQRASSSSQRYKQSLAPPIIPVGIRVVVCTPFQSPMSLLIPLSLAVEVELIQ